MVKRLSESTLALERLDSSNTAFYRSLCPDDRIFLHKQLENLPLPIQKELLYKYRTEPNRIKANIYLRVTRGMISQKLLPLFQQDFDLDRSGQKQMAERHAEMVRKIALKTTQQFILKNPILVSENSPENSERISNQTAEIPLLTSENPETNFCPLSEKFPANPGTVQDLNSAQSRASCGQSGNLAATVQTEPQLTKAVYQAISLYLARLGLQIAKPSKQQPITGIIKRLQHASWWRRHIRKLYKRQLESIQQLLNKVSRKAGIYCSDLTYHNRQHERAEQRAYMENSFIVNDAGERFSLKEVSDKNVSNPAVRRAELMLRMRGTEDLAKEQGYAGLFVTLTCPSKYHCAYSKSGDRNPNWQGATPRDGQDYLNAVWARTRAELARQDIQMFGMRVAEPQHDGTPHWHLLLFVNPAQLEQSKATMLHYAMEEDGNEPGAEENRVKFVDIDPAKGSATGYIAKYISKNIDGVGLHEDIEGGDALIAAKRVEAWASCWGIRQFQQIGNVSITVWRELRRLLTVQTDTVVEQARQLADSSNWQGFIKLMGGAVGKRKDQPLRPYYQYELNQDTGEIKTGQFDGLILYKLKGILSAGKTVITRLRQWRLEQAKGRSTLLLGVL